jgi:hypothetical protein
MKEVDPIEELHQIRRKIFKEAGGTPESLVRYYIKRQKQYADRLVDLSKPGSAQNTPRKHPTKPAPKAKPGTRRKAVVS